MRRSSSRGASSFLISILLAKKKYWITFKSFYLKFQSRCHWKCTSGLQRQMIFVCFYALLSCILCFHVYTHACFHLTSNVHIVKTFENRILFQTFEKWYNVSYRYVSYVKSQKHPILENRCMTFKTFWREGWGKPYLPPSKAEFYNKN